MKRRHKHLIKSILGRPLLAIYQPLKKVLIHAERQSLMAGMGYCEPDLELMYPWDIRNEQNVFIGKDVYIGPGAVMIADVGAAIHIGNKVMFGPGVKLIASDHRYDDPARTIKDSGYAVLADIRVGNDVWLGAGVTILKGISVGDGAVIGAGAVVIHNVGARGARAR